MIDDQRSIIVDKGAMKKDNFDSQKNPGFTSEGTSVSRRKFLKRSGGATAATVIAWNAMNLQAAAASGDSSQSSSWIPAACGTGYSTI